MYSCTPEPKSTVISCALTKIGRKIAQLAIWLRGKKMHRSAIKNHFLICIKVLVLHNILPVIDEVYGVLQGFNINYW